LWRRKDARPQDLGEIYNSPGTFIGTDGMKLALVSSEYPPYHWGGVGSASHALANQLAMRGHDVHVFTRKHSMSLVDDHPNIRMHMVKWLKLPMAFALSFGKNAVPLVNREGGFDAVIIFGNMTLLRKEDYKALRSPCLTKMCGTWAGERSALKFEDISLSSVSGANDLAVLKLSARYDRYEDYALLYSDAVVVECENEIRAINARMARYGDGKAYIDGWAKEWEGTSDAGMGGFLEKRGNVIRQVQLPDMGNFSPSKRDSGTRRKYAGDGARLLLFVGRLAARKNVMEAARIFARYLERHPDDSLMFIGKGNQKARLEAFMREHGLQKKVHILQDLGFGELAVHYANADAFIFPSLWEGFGLVLLEALASGLPAVSRPVGGAPEIIVPGSNGFLYEKEDDAVEALEKCASLDQKWLVDDGHKRYDMKNNIDRIEALCKRIASEGKTRSAAN
jgi:glycosyltransferase involved in cell wall biosynthesis